MLKALVLLHISIVIAGFTGVFGRLISADAYVLTLYRTLLASGLLFLLFYLQRHKVKFTRADLVYVGIGAVLALHWIGFYGSIKLANVSIGVVCLSAMAFFSALLEPVLLKRRLRLSELCFALIGMGGILLIFNFDARYRAGIVCGLICALLASIYTILNKKYAAGASSRERVVLLELAGGGLLLCLLLPGYLSFKGLQGLALQPADALYLFLLSTICTIGLYLLQVSVLRQISAFTVNLSYNLEPIYSIVLAMIIFAENRELTAAFYAGLGLIILAVLLQTAVLLYQRRRSEMTAEA